MKHIDIKDLYNNDTYLSNVITVCGWIRAVRESKNVCFVALNDGTDFNNLQLVIDKDRINEEVLGSLRMGASIMAKGMLVTSPNANQKIELRVQELKVLGVCPQDYPIQKKNQSMEVLREIPHLRARTNTFSAVFRIRSVITKAIHEYFQSNGYVYVNPPIITKSSFEGAGDLFLATTLDIEKVSRFDYNPCLFQNDFFGQRVGLSVSGQLEAEAMINGFGRVYTFAPSFRADSSNTKKHLAEFWIVEPELAFHDINGAKDEVKKLFKYIIKTVLAECSSEIAFLTKYYNHDLMDKLVKALETDFVDLDYTEAIDILKDSFKDFRYSAEWGTSLKTEHIRFLTGEVFKKPVFINNSPKELKPFYIKVNDDDVTVASADLHFPEIGDIFGASEKEADYDKLLARIKELNMDQDDYMTYLDTRKYGTVPHSGFGLGIERLVMYITGMENIRDTIPYPRFKCKSLKM